MKAQYQQIQTVLGNTGKDFCHAEQILAVGGGVWVNLLKKEILWLLARYNFSTRIW